jgi:protein arginine N-methyltransferase 1
MYSLRDYGDMIADQTRTDAYIEALRRSISPGTVVADIGTGFGFFAIAACRMGAGHVYAIESNPVVTLGQQFAAANDCADRITFFQALSTRVTLPEPVDVVVSDLRGHSPLFGAHIPTIIDARTRFLKPGGIQIPQRDHLWVSLAEAPKVYDRYAQPWLDQPHGLDLSAGWGHTATLPASGNVTPDQLLTQPANWASVDYTTITQPHVSGMVEQTILRAGVAHGLRLWFSTVLAEGIGYSSAPGSSVNIYNHLFLLLPEPVSVYEGDTLRLALRANLVNGEYLWRWETDIVDSDGQTRHSVRQSTFASQLLDPVVLRRRAPQHRPRLSADGLLAKAVLEAMDGEQSLQQIAESITRRFPDRFTSPGEAYEVVASLAVQFGAHS